MNTYLMGLKAFLQITMLLFVVIGFTVIVGTALKETQYPLWIDWGISVFTMVVNMIGLLGVGKIVGQNTSEIQYQNKINRRKSSNWASYKPRGTKEKWETLLP